jgi:hypothetical protein
MTLIQLYRDLTVVTIGDGRHTSFWLDSWVGSKPLSTQFPALFSLVQHTNVIVVESFSKKWLAIKILSFYFTKSGKRIS